jgi:polar amino acid transport system permease protein
MFDFDFLRENWLFITTGVGATLGITILSFLLAAPVAALVARGRRSTFLPIKLLFALYGLLVDGIPLYVLLFFLFLALPQLGIVIPGFAAGLLALTVHYSSRMSDVFYGRMGGKGISGEKSPFSWLPPLAGQFNNIIKDSALLSATGFVHEIMWRATRVGRAEFANLEALLLAGVIYLVLISVITISAAVINFITTTRPTPEAAV